MSEVKSDEIQLSRRQFLTGNANCETSKAETNSAMIGENCIAGHNIACRNCDDACPPRAIKFLAHKGGHYIPQIDEQSCTRCGECLSVCPVNAIILEGV